MPLLNVKNLQVRFNTPDGVVCAVNQLDFTLEQGQMLGIVGESGSGKSQTVLAIMGLLAKNGQAKGDISFRDKPILNLPDSTLNKIRGQEIAMIFQDPMTSLNPYLKISKQMTEVLTQHQGLSQKAAKQKAVEMLDAVKIPRAKHRIDMYPHEFSGGMRQRVMIAMALLCNPDLLIADEPTTALDVTVQAEILTLLQELQKEFHTSIILITHDLGIVAGLCDRVIVMYSGSVMEYGKTEELFYNPQHPYTQALLQAIPRLDAEKNTPLKELAGNPPNLLNLPSGCLFEPRCPYAFEICPTAPPPLETLGNERKKACYLEGLDNE